MMAGTSNTVTGSFQIRAKTSLTNAMSTVARKLAEKECTANNPIRLLKTTQPIAPIRPLRHKIGFGP